MQKSGFDQVKLKSEYHIVLADQVNIQTRRSITLDAPMLVSNGIGKVTSAQVTIGNLGTNQTLFDPLTAQQLSPLAGIGVLNVSAQLVDLTGNFVVSGVNQINITSHNDGSNAVNSNDIRLNGVLNAANTALTGSLHTQGNVTLTADQVYPSTVANFTLSVEDSAGNAAGNHPTGSIAIRTQHGASPVMSAGGKLTLSAADNRAGRCREGAHGEIILGTYNQTNGTGTQKVTLGSGSTTSVSSDGLTIP